MPAEKVDPVGETTDPAPENGEPVCMLPDAVRLASASGEILMLGEASDWGEAWLSGVVGTVAG